MRFDITLKVRPLPATELHGEHLELGETGRIEPRPTCSEKGEAKASQQQNRRDWRLKRQRHLKTVIISGTSNALQGAR